MERLRCEVAAVAALAVMRKSGATNKRVLVTETSQSVRFKALGTKRRSSLNGRLCFTSLRGPLFAGFVDSSVSEVRVSLDSKGLDRS